ncbi:ribose 5-phosphate isomerase B [Desulfobacter latus]|uniref:Ribose 5-phosphate isomerase B n=1 Tax=Desulfobacter latus TaxID=2292 RepID=A0A850T6W1_9BACT|nr:ribose 5-phosphate isomerase B [Desulfobacter latus]NWH05132.1 ribose 5-phosphate isomerase B [Desulfobacter latus]
MDKGKQIIIGSDHAAFELKEKIKELLTGLGYEVEDVGTHSTASVNYPDFGKKVAGAVSNGIFDRGILLCGTGIGMSMQANRFKGVRAALCSDIFSARLSRQHNDANILVMGGRMVGDILAFELVREWLATPFEGGRHLDRIRSLDDIG